MTCVVGGAVATFANIPLMCLFGAMVNNCVEYNDYKFGKRIVGMTNSANSFGMKIGSGIGASLIGWLLAAAGISRYSNLHIRYLHSTCTFRNHVYPSFEE